MVAPPGQRPHARCDQGQEADRAPTRADAPQPPARWGKRMRQPLAERASHDLATGAALVCRRHSSLAGHGGLLSNCRHRRRTRNHLLARLLASVKTGKPGKNPHLGLPANKGHQGNASIGQQRPASAPASSALGASLEAHGRSPSEPACLHRIDGPKAARPWRTGRCMTDLGICLSWAG